MDVIANALEVTGAAVIDRQGFVTAAKEVSEEAKGGWSYLLTQLLGTAEQTITVRSHARLTWRTRGATATASLRPSRTEPPPTPTWRRFI